MNILHLSQYFPPEAGAVQVRAMTVARTLVELGHQVTVITEVPNHPSGIIQPAYRGRLKVTETRDGVNVIHLWVKTSPEKSFKTRLLFYLSYMAAAIIAGITLPFKYDVIFANSPPLFVAAAGWIISLVRRKPFVLEVQDLWPESAVVLGELNTPRYIRWAELLETRCYRRAGKIIAVTAGIRDRLIAKGAAKQKLVLAPNGSNIDIFRPDPDGANHLRAKLALEGKFVVLYGGILGLAQGLNVVLQTADILRNQDNIWFVIVGDGPKRAELLAQKDELGLTNVLILPGQPLENMPAYLSMADVALVPLKKLDLFLGALPTKMFDAWACQTPTVITVDGEARQVIETAKAGVFVEPENPHTLAEAIINLQHNAKALRQMGVAGYNVTQKRYSLQAAARLIEGALQAVASVRP